VRFLNEEEERQYLEQSPPSNTLLPKQPIIHSGQDTPRVSTQSTHHWNEDDDGDWVDEEEPSAASHTGTGEDWVGLTTGVERVRVER
jgi:hypothetical protein